MSEKICKLCGKVHSENVGSHIFTESLIRSAFNNDGKKSRGDNEIIAEISLNKIDFDFFGANVLPEKRAEILGKEQTDDEIEATSMNAFINYDLVCRQCEKSFNPIETYFMSNIYSKLQIVTTTITECGFYELSSFEFYVSNLMIQLNVWRASASKFNDWSLDYKTEKSLAEYIFKCTRVRDITDMVNISIVNSYLIKNNRFAVAYLDQNQGDPSENSVLIDYRKSPYFFLLNKLLVVYSTNKTIGFELPKFINWSKAEMLKKISLYPQFSEDQSKNQKAFKVKYIDDSGRKQIVLGFIHQQWESMVRHAHRSFKADFYHKANTYPSKNHHLLLDYNIQQAILSGHKASPQLLINCCFLSLFQIFRN